MKFYQPLRMFERKGALLTGLSPNDRICVRAFTAFLVAKEMMCLLHLAIVGRELGVLSVGSWFS